MGRYLRVGLEEVEGRVDLLDLLDLRRLHCPSSQFGPPQHTVFH